MKGSYEIILESLWSSADNMNEQNQVDCQVPSGLGL